MVANGVLISRIIYAIQLWGGTSNYLLDMLQVLQNRAARLVTRRNIFTSQNQLLRECGWLNVRQMVAFHDVVQIFKTLKEEKPVSLYRKLSRTFSYRTRAAATGALVDNYRRRGDIRRDSFLVRHRQGDTCLTSTQEEGSCVQINCHNSPLSFFASRQFEHEEVA